MVPLVLRVLPVLKVLLVLTARWVQRVQSDRQVLMALRVLPVLKVLLVMTARWVQRVQSDRWVLMALRVLTARWVPPDRQGLTVRREPLALQVRLDRQVLTVSPVSQR